MTTGMEHYSTSIRTETSRSYLEDKVPPPLNVLEYSRAFWNEESLGV